MPTWLKKLLITAVGAFIVVFACVRILERALLFHPSKYDATGNDWSIPAGVQHKNLTAADGTRLHLWRFPPATPARAVIFYSHGNGGNLTNVSAVAEDMARRGYEVLLWDYRGYGRSGGSVAGDEPTFLRDAETVFAEARTTSLPVILWGQSLGTTVSAHLAATQGCAALVMESGLASGYDFARTQLTWLPAWLHAFAKFTFASADKLRRVNCPVLIAHGTADGTIAFEHARLLFDAVQHQRKRLLPIPGAGHVLINVPGYRDQVAEFLFHALPLPPVL